MLQTTNLTPIKKSLLKETTKLTVIETQAIKAIAKLELEKLEAIHESEPIQIKPRKKSRVLIVEDDKCLSRLLGDLLKSNGYDVKTATDGDTGLLNYLSYKPDIAFIDFSMPGFNGLEVAERFREDNAKLPIVMMTGLIHADLEHRAKHLNISHFLPKPFELGEVVKVAHEFAGED